MKSSGFLLLALLGFLGCRDALVEPQEPFDPALLPQLAGRWAGTYNGVLDLSGGTEPPARDAFRVTLDVRRVVAEFPFEGTVAREADPPQSLYSCGLRLADVDREGNTRFDCVRGTQLGDVLVLRVEVRPDSSDHVLRGQVRDGLGSAGAKYPIELRRAAGWRGPA